MKIITTEKKPIKMWLDNIEDGALQQARNLANTPFTVSHVAIMPDSHLGYGMPIGGVLATRDVIIPNAVGVDIGCGMGAIKTSIKELDIEILKKIMGKIRENVPVGFSHQREKQDKNLMPKIDMTEIVAKEFDNALTQIGTLGGGNHFIEIQKSEQGDIWIMLHSGSRNIGFKTAHYYNELATKLNEKWSSDIPKEWKLAFLPLDSKEGQDYIKDMNYCLDFAQANRDLIMQRIKKIFTEELSDVKFLEEINIHHNFATLENHFGKNVMVHRKGATQAKDGQLGIIPGSQGTSSYIVKGKGNRDSFESCSHGAGRKMGRKQAQRTLNLEEETKKLDEQGILHAIRGIGDLDEASGAYKNIDEVINNELDLIEPIVKLKPMGVIKG